MLELLSIMLVFIDLLARTVLFLVELFLLALGQVTVVSGHVGPFLVLGLLSRNDTPTPPTVITVYPTHIATSYPTKSWQQPSLTVPAIGMRILVVDDNERVRQGVMDILASQTNWQVCGEAKDGKEAIQKARDLQPDVILLDISMPGLNGLETARLLRQEVANAKILIMSQNDPVQLLPGAIQAGAHGCVDKGHLGTDLLSSIESIAGDSTPGGPANTS